MKLGLELSLMKARMEVFVQINRTLFRIQYSSFLLSLDFLAIVSVKRDGIHFTARGDQFESVHLITGMEDPHVF